MNKVLLLYPPSAHIIRTGFPLPVLSAYLKEYNFPVKVIDCPGLEMGVERLIQEIQFYNPDIIAVSIPSTVMRVDGIAALKAIRKVFTNKFIVAGGIHVTIAPKEIAPLCNIVCLGYGHETLKEIAEKYPRFEVYSIKGIGYMKNGYFTVNEWREADFSKISTPDWESIPFEKYNDHVITGDPTTRSFPVFTSMGCVYNCSFCCSSKMSKKKVMFRDIGKVIDEIEYMKEKTGFEYMRIIDPTFTLNHAHVYRFCDALIKRKVKIKWGMSTTVKNHNKEIALAMKEAGLARIGFSFESCNDRILETVGKKITKKEMYDTAKLYVDLKGVLVDSGFIIGFPEDTIETVWETLTYSTYTPIHNLFVSLMCPFPGTEIFQIAKTKGRFSEKILYDASPFDVCYIPPSLDSYDMNKMKTFSFYYFYSSNKERLNAWLGRFQKMQDYPRIEREWLGIFNNRDELTFDYFEDYCRLGNNKRNNYFEPYMVDFSRLHEKSSMLKR